MPDDPRPPDDSFAETQTRDSSRSRDGDSDGPTISYRPVIGQATVAAKAARELPDRPELADLPDYKIESYLGGGGTGEVYLASHRSLPDKRFAVKFLRANRLDQAQIERFKREAKALLELRHPHIVQFRHFGDFKGTPYLVMEFMEGGPLTERIANYPGNPRAAVELLVKITDAVEHMHRAEIIHRDIKPGNILIDKNGEPCLADFGLAKFAVLAAPADETAASTPQASLAEFSERETQIAAGAPEKRPSNTPPNELTKAGAVMGTLAYMPPEQLSGENERIGRPADVWALGVILFELLTGQRPFRADTSEDLCHLIDTSEPARPSAIRPGVDAKLDRIVGRCLQKDSGERYPTAAALQRDLNRWLRPPWFVQRKFQAAAAITVALVTGLILYFWPAPPATVPPQPTRAELMARINQRLVNGETVSLIREDGSLEVPWEVLAGADSTKIERGADGYWYVHSSGLALVEILKNVDIDNYRYIVEMRPVKQDKVPEVAIYAGERRVAHPKGEHHFLVDIAYQESPDNFLAPAGVPGGNPPDLPPGVKVLQPVGAKKGEKEHGKSVISLRLSTYNDHDQGMIPGHLADWKIDPDIPQVGGPWRILEIWANREDFLLSFSSEMKYHLKPKIVFDRTANPARIWPKEVDPLPRVLSPLGGLGLVVKKGGSVAIRSIQVIPVTQR